MSPEECAEYLKTDVSITSAHQESAQEGQTEVDSYFISNLFLRPNTAFCLLESNLMGF